MKINQWTLCLATAGVISLPSAIRAQEKEQKATIEPIKSKQPKRRKP